MLGLRALRLQGLVYRERAPLWVLAARAEAAAVGAAACLLAGRRALRAAVLARAVAGAALAAVGAPLLAEVEGAPGVAAVEVGARQGAVVGVRQDSVNVAFHVIMYVTSLYIL